MNDLTKIISLLSSKEKKNAIALMGMVLIMALFDMIGVASILPFMAVISNPQMVFENEILNVLFDFSTNFGVGSLEQFLLLLGGVVFILFLMSMIFKATTTYSLTRFAMMREYSIGERLVTGYLNQPYSWFLSRNSSELGKNILSEVQKVIEFGLLPLMTLFAQSAVTFALLVLLLLVDPLLALTVGLVLGLAYIGIFTFVGGHLKRLGEIRTTANQERFTAISEAFGAAKELKVGGLESVFIDRFAKPAEAYASAESNARIISLVPRFGIESVAFGGIMLVVLYLLTKSGNFSQVLPIISLYVFAGYRLMPAMQQMYLALTKLRFVGPALEIVYADIESFEHKSFETTDNLPMQLDNSIALNRFSYRYPGNERLALRDIDLIIPARTRVGFVGPSGSGKSTLVDAILALIAPSTGALVIDGQNINDMNRSNWQRAIGYVPQSIYLSDASVLANIAFGVPEENIDHEAVEKAAKIANLHSFVTTELSDGYHTLVGERGVRLSGGQRQRIGIARALYHQPQVLILDEATSALDTLTEQVVMEAVDNLGEEITIVMIAHRLSTVRKCDKIFLLENGTLSDSGTYDELQIKNARFRDMSQ